MSDAETPTVEAPTAETPPPVEEARTPGAHPFRPDRLWLGLVIVAIGALALGHQTGEYPLGPDRTALAGAALAGALAVWGVLALLAARR